MDWRLRRLSPASALRVSCALPWLRNHVSGRLMSIPCDRRRLGPMEHGQASARPCGGAAGCRGQQQLAGRQARAALVRGPTPRMAALSPSNPATGSKTVTRSPRPHSLQGNLHALSVHVLEPWNRTGTGRNMAQVADIANELAKWNRGTVERISLYARAGARIVAFHGSTVPEGYIQRGFQSLSRSRQAVPARFHGSTNIRGVQNGSEI